MKKIMVMLAVTAVAVVANAAQMKWGSGTLYVPTVNKDNEVVSSTTKLTGTYGGSASLYVLTATEYAAIMTSINDAELTKANDISKFLYGKFKGVEADKTGSFMMGVSTLQDPNTYAKGDVAYGVVIYTAYDSNQKDENGNYTGNQYYIANIGSAEFDADSTITISNMGTKLNGTTNTDMAWQVVPEPTSGLMLLLGVAGLALRRRRA